MRLYDTKNKYVAFKVFKCLIRDLVNARYDRCKFKLICDDLGLANLIVRGREDLTVVGVVDLEWSYIGPDPLFGSAPWWLLKLITDIMPCHLEIASQIQSSRPSLRRIILPVARSLETWCIQQTGII